VKLPGVRAVVVKRGHNIPPSAVCSPLRRCIVLFNTLTQGSRHLLDKKGEWGPGAEEDAGLRRLGRHDDAFPAKAVAGGASKKQPRRSRSGYPLGAAASLS